MQRLPMQSDKDKAPHGTQQGSKDTKRFMLLLMGTVFIFIGLILLIWLIPFWGWSGVGQWAPAIISTISIALLLFIVLVTAGLALQVCTGKAIRGTRWITGLTIRYLLPVMEALGRLFGIKPNKVRHVFIDINNKVTLNTGKKFKPSEIVLLLPHCIQKSECPRKLSHNVNNCKRCGLCTVGDLLNLSDEYGITMFIATGGTMARLMIKKARPKVIIAVACERDLASGIQDTYPLLVLGVLNRRPNGPCIDTNVDITEVRAALDKIIEI